VLSVCSLDWFCWREDLWRGLSRRPTARPSKSVRCSVALVNVTIVVRAVLVARAVHAAPRMTILDDFARPQAKFSQVSRGSHASQSVHARAVIVWPAKIATVTASVIATAAYLAPAGNPKLVQTASKSF